MLKELHIALKAPLREPDSFVLTGKFVRHENVSQPESGAPHGYWEVIKLGTSYCDAYTHDSVPKRCINVSSER